MNHLDAGNVLMDNIAETSNSYLFGPVLPGPDASPVPYFASSMAYPSAGRYWRTLKHLRASQIFFLARHRLFGRNDLTRWPKANVALKVHDRPPKMLEWQPVLARRIIQLGDVRF